MTAVDTLVGHALDPFFGLVWLDAARFDEAVRSLRDDGFAAPASRAQLITALRSDPPGVIVRATDFVAAEDVELVVRTALTGHVTVVCGSTPSLEAALAGVRDLPMFDQRSVR